MPSREIVIVLKAKIPEDLATMPISVGREQLEEKLWHILRRSLDGAYKLASGVGAISDGERAAMVRRGTEQLLVLDALFENMKLTITPVRRKPVKKARVIRAPRTTLQITPP